jgi:hypothetical protein
MTRGTVFVGSEFVAKYLTGGGNFWVPVQYLRGLLELGYDAWWLELLGAAKEPGLDEQRVAQFWANVDELGLGERVTLAHFPHGPVGELDANVVWQGALDEAGFRARARDALLLNPANSIPPAMRACFARTALFDIDPGPFQLWARDWDMGVGKHDVHLTIGMNLGEPDSPIPLGGVEWKRVWPSVHLASWPQQPLAAAGRYTTITQWWTTQYAFLDGEVYDCNKREGFVRHIELPRLAGLELELAANVHPGETEERELIARHGWALVDPAACARTPGDFQRYVQAARGEVSAAKPGYVKARSGWVSDRTLCFLASGRPCIVEDVGAARHLPHGLGLTFFRETVEGAERIRAVEADYARASRDARALAEECFDTRVVLPKLLAHCGL